MSPLLTMPLFVSVSEAVSRMQLDAELNGVEDVVTSGIMSAQLHVEMLIDGKLQRQSHDETFFLDSQSFSNLTPGGVFRLELPSGFLRSDVTPIYTVTGAGPNFGPFSTFEAIDSTLMKVEAAKGYLLVDRSYADVYLRAQVTTGFEDGTRAFPVDDVEAYDSMATYAAGDKVVLDGVVYEAIASVAVGQTPPNATKWTLATVDMESLPPGLHEAILSLVPVFMYLGQIGKSDEKMMPLQYRRAYAHAEGLITPFARIKGFAIRPNL